MSEERLFAEGFDREGKLVEIPAREWTHLQLFEDGKQDVLRYNALDRFEPYTSVRFRREDLLRLWPRSMAVDVDALELGNISAVHIEPMLGNASHVPFCVGLHWIVAGQGAKAVQLRDEAAWLAGANEYLPRISAGQIEILGREEGGFSKPLPPSAFASIRVPFPLKLELRDILGESSPYIDCNFYIGETDWHGEYNDKAYFGRRAMWTHLQVRREQVLEFWPKPSGTINAETSCFNWLADQMRQSPGQRPHSKAEFQAEASKRFENLGDRQFIRAWSRAITETGAHAWSKSGRTRKLST